jgi:hypothetical protein
VLTVETVSSVPPLLTRGGPVSNAELTLIVRAPPRPAESHFDAHGSKERLGTTQPSGERSWVLRPTCAPA